MYTFVFVSACIAHFFSAQVQETHASGQRMKLDVSIQAPEITIPLKSDSDEAIVADLGSLSLSNTFHIAKQVDASPGSTSTPSVAVFERHAIKLDNLKIFRCVQFCAIHI